MNSNTLNYSKHSPGKFILSIDWETTGSSFRSLEETFKRFQGIAFGAVIANSETFEPIKTLYREIKYNPKYEWTQEAEAIHGLSQEYLEDKLSEEEAAIDLAEFIYDIFGTSKVMFLGHNPLFDIEATRQLLVPYNVMPELFHVILNTSAAGFITIGKYRSNDVFNFFSGENRDKHNALDDALLALETARNIRLLMNVALGK